MRSIEKTYPEHAQVQEFQRQFGKSIVDLLRKANQAHLKGIGEILPMPFVDRNIIRWTLAWVQDQFFFYLHIVVCLADNDQQLNIERVFVKRHASAPYNFECQVPTTRMRNLNGFSLEAIKQAVDAEFALDRVPERSY